MNTALFMLWDGILKPAENGPHGVESVESWVEVVRFHGFLNKR